MYSDYFGVYFSSLGNFLIQFDLSSCFDSHNNHTHNLSVLRNYFNQFNFFSQKTALTYHIETLKREIQSALHDRDKALKQCYDLQERFGEFTAKEESQREGYKSRFEYAYNRER